MKYITALLFALILFVSFPLEILYNNIDEFITYEWFYIICVGGSVLFVIFVIGLSRLLNPSGFVIILKILFLLSLYILIADVITPLSITELRTGNETPDEPLMQICLQAILFIALAALIIKIPQKTINTIALPITIGILLLEVYLAVNLYLAKLDEVRVSSPSSTATDFRGNIYHFIFDSYEGKSLILDCISALNLEEDFRGFLNYHNARSNFLGTQASVSSFMSGRLYTGREEFDNWKKKTKELSIVNKLRERGFNTTVYTINNVTANKYADNLYVKESISPFHGIDLWLLRIVPAFLRQEVFRNGNGVISRNWGVYFNNADSGDFRSYSSYLQYKEMLMEESLRQDTGEYVFAHFHPPHGPYQLDRNGKFVGRTDRLESSYLATNMMANIIRILKSNGRFDSSLIIMQSDHGRQDNEELYSKVFKPKGSSITKADFNKRNELMVDERSKALLLVKLPWSKSNKLETNYGLVQLLDMPRLIQYVINEKGYIAISKLDRLFNRDEVPVFTWQQKQQIVDGKCLDNGQFHYYTVSIDERWSKKPGCLALELNMD